MHCRWHCAPLLAGAVFIDVSVLGATVWTSAQVSNYATDIFTPIFDAIRAVSGAAPYTDKVRARHSPAVLEVCSRYTL